jgi:hypothetical protein
MQPACETANGRMQECITADFFLHKIERPRMLLFGRAVAAITVSNEATKFFDAT